MKKIIILTTLTLISISLFAQKIIEQPKFSATTAEYVKITRIELHDTITRIDFEVTYFPKWWIIVNTSETYIQDSNGGEKLFVKRADGIVLNEKHTTPENGLNKYTLYFPPLDKNTSKIDYLEGNWKIFDIDLVGSQVSVSAIPKEIQGNWLKTDGSNEWVYGIYEDKVIYKNEIWDKIVLNSKGKSYQLTLKNETSQENIFIKTKKDKIFIGDSPENLQLYSKTKTYVPDYVLKDDEEFKQPIFKIDTAIYHGYIDDYHPRMDATGKIYVSNIITQEHDEIPLKINSDGSFYCKLPIQYPKQVYVRILRISETVFLEPGKTTFQLFDLSEYTAPYKNSYDRNKRERKSLFMGENARINADLLAMDTIQYFNYSEAKKFVLDMTADEYKTYCLEIMKKEQKALAQFEKENLVNKKALQLKKMQIPFSAYEHIMSFNSTRNSVYREKNNIPWDQREITLEPVIVGKDYYDFINADDLNDPISLVAGSAYEILINRIQYAQSVRPKLNFMYAALKDTIVAKGLEINDAEESMLNKLVVCEDRDCINEVINADTDTWNKFYKKHNELLGMIGQYGQQQVWMKNINEYFGLGKGLATDVMCSQLFCGRVKGSQKPFNEQDIKEIRQNIGNPVIVNYLMRYSDAKQKEIDEKIEANKTKTGYVINETPETEADKLFEAIIEKYKGKVVFVDFWATWCGPCRSGMERIKPLKEELKGEDIEFVYITNQSSPIDTWNMMIPDIKGEHYRVEGDEWSYLSSKFKITGIPHYVLVDKSGKVVNEKIYFASSNEELKMMFQEYLVQ